MNNGKELLEKTYEKPGAVWTRSEPPTELVELVESGKIKPCKCLDVGCGEGFYAIYLASKGFDVTAIDLSENAIKYAKQNAEDAGVDVKFMAMDVADLDKLDEKFGFVLEWALLHLVMPENREKYVGDVANLLNENGKYFSVCFNDRDKKFGEGKLRIIPENARAIVGAKMYFSSSDELMGLFGAHFEIIESKVFEKKWVDGVNVLNYFFMEGKNGE
ncbi:class I SAM-dependent methyltransferase [archaeon]|mgnify:FL=1|jgi:2-polyprenyl-3-methyl-5-hydroxy-6-metoxy-1,4-benzoquinol methylase|nr:class I SAM-dependent methyltransferase [archaeon]MBT3577202.1 class I SAM-dependent methyltransferase [archaeon]MBT6820211.1 class I SAM-dependent methyltransferase [archaeon]MBT6956757.1 class I SAM-dependent methyltransferase [archaeon]MBT7025416.1 class I SAM-dependent methyltransferase [archaeon]